MFQKIVKTVVLNKSKINLKMDLDSEKLRASHFNVVRFVVFFRGFRCLVYSQYRTLQIEGEKNVGRSMCRKCTTEVKAVTPVHGLSNNEHENEFYRRKISTVFFLCQSFG